MDKTHQDSRGEVVLEIPARSHGSLTPAPAEPLLLKFSVFVLQTGKQLLEIFKQHAGKASELIRFFLHLLIGQHGKESSGYGFFPFIGTFQLLRNGSNISYAYCTARPDQHSGCLVIKVDNPERALEILTR